MSRPRANISWRWIIRGTCLGLLGLCVGVWGLSYIYAVDIAHRGSRFVSVGANGGTLMVCWYDSQPAEAEGLQGWSADVEPAAAGTLSSHFTLRFARPPGFGVNWWLQFPTALLAVLLGIVLWIAWRKTGRGGRARGFPVGPLVSRREGAGG